MKLGFAQRHFKSFIKVLDEGFRLRRWLFLVICLGLLAQHPDRKIADEVSRLLTQANLGDISISSYRGEVVLSGVVSSEDQKLMAENLAASVEGVKRVKSNLRVDVTRARVDQQLFECALPELTGLRGKVSVNLNCTSSEILITGLVDFAEDEEALINSVKRANPWASVRSQIQVAKVLDDQQLHASILANLKENGHNLEGISFKVSNGVVTFEGKVSNHRVVDAILASTLMVDGVKDIKSKVLIGQ
jgi:osmotically-inducible protein OsmY